MSKLISTNTIKKEYTPDDLTYLYNMLPTGLRNLSRVPTDRLDSCTAPIGAPLKYYGSKPIDD